MLCSIPLITIIVIYTIAIIVSIIAIKNFWRKLEEVIKRIIRKFPTKTFKDIHVWLIIKILLKSCMDENSNSYLPKESKNKKTLSKEEIKNYSPLKLLFIFIRLKIKSFFEAIIGFMAIIILLPYIFSSVLNKNVFKNHKFIIFLIDIIFYYLLTFAILIFLGYGVSNYNNNLSIILILIYVVISIWTCFEKFNSFSLENFINKDKENFEFKSYINLLLGLIIGFASIYYNLYKIDSNNFISSNNHFNFIDSIYFSIVTFATVGFGDIIPKSNLAKIVVSCEILTSILVLIFLASVYINKKIKEPIK